MQGFLGKAPSTTVKYPRPSGKTLALLKHVGDVIRFYTHSPALGTIDTTSYKLRELLSCPPCFSCYSFTLLDVWDSATEAVLLLRCPLSPYHYAAFSLVCRRVKACVHIDSDT